MSILDSSSFTIKKCVSLFVRVLIFYYKCVSSCTKTEFLLGGTPTQNSPNPILNLRVRRAIPNEYLSPQELPFQLRYIGEPELGTGKCFSLQVT